MAAPEGEREARKRRERRDSGCAHERKERRPHSEERLPPTPPPPPLHDYNRLESERRAERLSRARRPQFGGKRRRPSTRITKQPKENEHASDESRCDTPPHFGYLITQKSELSPESERVETGGRHEEAEYVRRDERSVPPRRVQPSADRRLDKITKKISVLKKSIAKYENEYEVQNGHAITPSERITHVQLTRMHESLRNLQEEKRCIKTDPVEYALKAKAAKQQKERDAKLDAALNSDKPMADLVRDIEEDREEIKKLSVLDCRAQEPLEAERFKDSARGSRYLDKWLQGCREMDGRASVPEARWTGSQLTTEKLCVQRVLLRLEAARGRPPIHSADRGAARHLYDRYRAVKRALTATRNDAITGGTNGELATIHEHETIVFSSSLDSSSDSQEKTTDSSQETTETPLQSPPTRETGEELPSSTSSAPSAASDEYTPTNEGLHCLGLADLTRALAEAKLQKCVLRRCIKEYEVNFELQNSRKVQKDDKKSNEEEYIRYKAIKARIKLLNALINKQKSKT